MTSKVNHANSDKFIINFKFALINTFGAKSRGRRCLTLKCRIIVDDIAEMKAIFLSLLEL